MIIRSNRDYRIYLQEDFNCSQVSIKVNPILQPNLPYLEFKGSELLEAIMIMGLLPDEAKSQKVELARTEEYKFKRHMVQAVLKENKDLLGNRYLSLDPSKTIYLDSSEKAVISYWLGMFFATLLARHQYGFENVVHYKRFEKSVYCISKISKTPFKDPSTGKIVKLSTPDLIAMDGKYCEYGVFEAKGYDSFDKSKIGKAINQVKQIRRINGNSDILKIVAYSRLKSSDIRMRAIDPTGGIYDISFNKPLLLLWQYAPIADLFAELRLSDSRIEMNEGYFIYKGGIFPGIEQIRFDANVCRWFLNREYDLGRMMADYSNRDVKREQEFFSGIFRANRPILRIE